VETWTVKAVADYMHISFYEVYELCYIDFLFLFREAFISRMQKTTEGREYLQKSWELEQTEMDYEGLNKLEQQLHSK
jgi:hypothetical protein